MASTELVIREQEDEWYPTGSNTATEQLLESREFQHANVMSIGGCLKRARLIEQARMPPMQVSLVTMVVTTVVVVMMMWMVMMMIL